MISVWVTKNFILSKGERIFKSYVEYMEGAYNYVAPSRRVTLHFIPKNFTRIF